MHPVLGGPSDKIFLKSRHSSAMALKKFQRVTDVAVQGPRLGRNYKSLWDKAPDSRTVAKLVLVKTHAADFACGIGFKLPVALPPVTVVCCCYLISGFDDGQNSSDNITTTGTGSNNYQINHVGYLFPR